MALHDDRTFVRHFSWVILALVVITIIFIFISFLIVGVTGVDSSSGYTYVQYMKKHPAAVAAAASARSAAAAPIETAGGKAAAGGGHPDAQAIWQAHCAACHASGVAGAPKIGDKQAWGPILAKTSMATLYKRAINGYQGPRGFMPPKGGAAGLSAADVKAAASYMILKSGGAKATAAAPATQAPSQPVAANGRKLNGEKIWQAHCSACHATGVAGAPKIGDKQAWGPILVKTDMATLYRRAINGYSGDRGFMPPRGGAAGLSDSEVKAAVNYMVGKSGGHPAKQGG